MCVMPAEEYFSSRECDGMFMMDAMEMIFAESGTGSVTSSVFRYSDMQKGGSTSVGRVEGFVLRRGVKIYFDQGSDMNGELGVEGNVNSVPGAPDSVRAENGVRMLEGCT